MDYKIKAIIVDDEPAAAETLLLSINQACPEVEVIHISKEIIDAHTKIVKLKPDLVFLDIDLGNKISGFDLLELFKNIEFKIIFVTAFNNFAIKAIKYAALDYILKPVSKIELIQAIQKAQKTIAGDNNFALLKEQLQTKSVSSKIALQVGKQFNIISINDIINCTSDGNFTRVFTINEEYFASKPLKEIEELLENSHFYRVHKSHLINIHHIKSYSLLGTGNITMKNKQEIPISRFKKEDISNILKNIFTQNI